MHLKAKNQAAAPVNLREKYDFLSESWHRVDRAISSGEIHSIEPEFKVGRRRVYERRALDCELSLRKFGPERLAEARQHRAGLFPLVPMHEAPVEPTMPRVPMPRAYEMAWAENAARDRINRPTPKKKLRLTASPPLQWALTYEIDADGEFKLTGSMARVGRKKGQGAGGER